MEGGTKQWLINGHQVMGDGKTVWVNAPRGICVARFSKNGMEICQGFTDSKDKQDCYSYRIGPSSESDWVSFVRRVDEVYDVLVPEELRPMGIET